MNQQVDTVTPSDIEIDVQLDAATFRHFCLFDAFQRKRQWLKPVLISMTLWTIALALMLFWPEQTGTFAGLLTGLGLALLLLYFGLNLLQIQVQIFQNRLKTPQSVYALTLNREGVCVSSAQNKASPAVTLPWDHIGPAYRRRGCVYLYVYPKRALLLPDNQANVPAADVWAYLCQKLGDSKCVETHHLK